jgi:hypothetical protein
MPSPYEREDGGAAPQVRARIQRAITLRAITEFQFCRLGDKRAGEMPAPLQTQEIRFCF